MAKYYKAPILRIYIIAYVTANAEYLENHEELELAEYRSGISGY